MAVLGAGPRSRLPSVAESTRLEESIPETPIAVHIGRDATSAGSRNSFRWRFLSAISTDVGRGSSSTQRVRRNNRRPCSKTSSLGVEEILPERSASKTPDDASKVSFDYDASEVDDNDEEYFDDIPKPTDDDLSVKIYGRACTSLRIIPCSYFARNLVNPDLILKWQVLGVTGAKACAIGLVTNTCVTNLVLCGNDIRNQGAMYFAEMLKENLYISELTLAENGISTAGLRAVCDVLKENRNIRKVDFSGNGLQEFDAVYITELVNANHRIHELILHHNCFREQGGKELACALERSTTLEVVDLSWNHLRMKGGVAIGGAMEKNSSIRELRLGWNGFFLEGCGAIRKALLKNTVLEDLDLECNRFNKECLVVLLDGLRGNTTLKRLHISNNPITSNGARMIPSVLKQCPQSGVEFIDIESQSVDQIFMGDLEEIQSTRPLTVKHGSVFYHEDMGSEEDPLLDEDPMMVLMEFMRQKNMRLVDLFTSLDEDGSKSLSWDEFRDGLKTYNIPMTAQSVDKLLRKLDTDGDGEVDFGELMEGQREYKKKVTRIQQQKVEGQEDEMTRVATKIRAIMAMNQMKKEKEKEKQKEKEQEEKEQKEKDKELKEVEQKEKEASKKKKK